MKWLENVQKMSRKSNVNLFLSLQGCDVYNIMNGEQKKSRLCSAVWCLTLAVRLALGYSNKLSNHDLMSGCVVWLYAVEPISNDSSVK